MVAAVAPGGVSGSLVAETLGHLLRQRTSTHGGREFLRCEGRSMSFAETDRRSDQVAAWLKTLGVARGDRVAVMMPNGLEFPVCWLGIGKAGAIMVPVNVQYQARDLVYTLADSGASLALVAPHLVEAVETARAQCPALRRVVAVPSDTMAGDTSGELQLVLDSMPTGGVIDAGHDDLFNIQYTSGTTGDPKGCMLTHEYWVLLGQRAAHFARMQADDVALTAQPFYYMDPQWNVAMCLVAGATLVILPRFSATTFWKSVRDSGATFFYVLGTMPVFLLKQPPDPLVDRTHRVRFVACSGIVPSLHADIEERWGVPWREVFGMTETGADLMVPVEESQSVGTGWMGRPIDGKEACIMDDTGKALGDNEPGELCVRGRGLMRGYWNRPEATAERLRGGWLHTGDLVVREASGHYRMVGRLKDMIRRGGENISAAEVEGVLAEHPAVRAAAVVPVPDELRGEEVKAFVQLQEPSTPPAPDQLLAFVRERLALFKSPRFIEFVDEFPRTPSERIEKHKLLAGRSDQRRGAWDASTGAWG